MNKNTNKHSIWAILSLSAVMFSAYVGPGFASGAQTVNYFLTKGWIGVFLGPFIAGIMCFVFTLLLFEINRIYKPNSYKEAYNTIYQQKGLQLFFGTFKEVQVIVVVFISLAAQISTAANLLKGVYGMNIWVASILFILSILALSLWGSKILRGAGSVIAICIIAICIYIAVKCFGAAMPGMLHFVGSRKSYTDFGYTSGPYAWFSMLMIVVFFMNGYEACIPASKGIIQTRKDVLIHALATALLCAVSTIIFTMIFASGMPGITKVMIPTLWAMTELTSSNILVQTLYVIFAIAAMLSSSMSFIFTVSERFQAPLGKVWKGSTEFLRKLTIALIFVFVCTIGSSFGLLNIIKYGYNIFTMFVGPVMLLPLVISVPYRLMKDRKKGILDEKCNLTAK